MQGREESKQRPCPQGAYTRGDCVLRITLSVLHGYLIPLHPSLRSLPSSPLHSGIDVLPSGSLPTPSAQTDHFLLSTLEAPNDQGSGFHSSWFPDGPQAKGLVADFG